MQPSPDVALLESLARDTESSLDEVRALFERERAALTREATVPNFIELLAVRRVRHQLMSAHRH